MADIAVKDELAHEPRASSPHLHGIERLKFR
jgi:hypothetical protein